MSVKTQADAIGEVMVKPLHVDVFAYREGDDILFAHAWRREGDPKKNKGKIKIPRGEGGVPIHFHLTDRTQLHLSFLPSAHDAMWVDTADCPTKAGNGGQITFLSSAPNLLKVSDANRGNACTLHFALRFTGDSVGEGPPYEYDPEIRNSGGG